MKAKRIVSMLLVAVMLIGMVPGTVFAEEALENVALGKMVTASSSYNELYTPDKLVDGNLVDDIGRWNSQATNGAEWVLIDLEGVFDVTQIKLDWWAWGNVAGTVVVSASNNGVDYEIIDEVSDNYNVDSNTFDYSTPVVARFIKLEFNNAADVWGYSLREVQVYGTLHEGYGNIALDKTVTASSSFNDIYTPDKIVDGNTTDDIGRWNSQATTGEEWVLIDLGKLSSIHEIKMSWWTWATVAGTLTVYKSSDGATYEEIGKVTDNINVAENKFLLPAPVEAKYIKIVMGTAPDAWGYSLKEVEVNGIELPADDDEEQDAPLKNLAMGKVVTASSSYNELYTPENIVDGDTVSDIGRWNSQGLAGEEWIQIDLGQTYAVSQIVLKWWAAVNLASSVSVQVSTDGSAFTEVKNYADNTELINQVDLSTPVSARYVKIVMNGCASDWGYSLSEVEVYSKDHILLDNLAFGKNVYVSEIYNDNWIQDIEAYYVTDGQYNTRWSSSVHVDDPPSNPVEEWLMIDLEKVSDLSELVIYWNENVVYAKDFDILTSVNGVDYDNVLNIKTDTYVQMQSITLPENTQGRYVKFAFHVPSYIYGYSIQEIAIYGVETEETGTDLDVSEAELALYTGSMIVAQSEAASGGFYVTGIDYRDSATFEKVPQSGNLQIKYKAKISCGINVYIDGTYAVTVECPATEADQFGVASADVYIPANSSVKLVPTKSVDLDRVDWNADPQITVSENILLAKDGQLSNATIVNAYPCSMHGDVVSAGKDAFVFFGNLPDNAYNTVAVKYIAQTDVSISLQAANGESKSFVLPASDQFGFAYIRLAGAIGGSLKLTTFGEVILDTLELMTTARSETVDVSFGSQLRTDILLDGIWECTVGEYEDTLVPAVFDKTIPVPGLWDLADFDLGDDEGKALWYQKTINITEAIPDGQRIILRINKAYYGRTIFVNGVKAGQYYYNFTASQLDITDYLVVGENKIQIKLGTYESGRMDPENPAHMGYDREKSSYLPGLVDSVSLILNKDPYVDRVQTAPNLDNGTLRVVTQLKNDTAEDIYTDVTFKIYELGVYENRVPAMNQLVQTVVLPNQLIAAGGALDLDQILTITGFNKEEKAWRPGNPYLYRLVIETSGDVMEHRFGMRTFVLDQETGKSLLNGEVYYLRGTNVVINRFYEDAKRSDHPWDEEWVRNLFAEYQYVNWEGARFCVGFPPDFWYDICDEIGFMVVDEYPYWACDDHIVGDGCTVEGLTTEYTTWIYQRNNHPCVIFWDAQNESNSAYDVPLTAQVIANVRGIDIQGRAWENGWGPVQSAGDACEQHPYPFANTRFTLDHIGTDAMYFYDSPDTKLDYINEYGWVWVDREGNPTLLTAGGYKTGNRGDNPEEYKAFYATAIAQMTERWRASRRYFGIFQFCGLTYSIDDGSGYTSDVLCPDLTDPIIRPEQKSRLRSAFAPVGLVINDWSTSGLPGSQRVVPVLLVNDLNEAVKKEVTVSLYKNHKSAELELLHTQTQTIEAEALALSDITEFLVTLPEEAGDYTIIASYAVEGEDPITSTRYLVVAENPGSEDELIPEDAISGDGTVTETIRFNDEDSERFDFYHSTDGGFVVQNGKLESTEPLGEFKALVKDVAKVKYAAVTVFPGQSGLINAGIYLNASDPADAQDSINAMAVMLQSNYTDWTNAENRVDILIGSFPTWQEHFRLISQEGDGNNLFLGNLKEPLRLEVTITYNVLDIKVSLVSDPDVFITASYEYVGAGDLSIGTAGLRSQYSDNSLDNFTVQYLPVPSTPVVDENAIWDFSNAQQAWDFMFYQSGTNGMSIADGTLGAAGTNGENKVILNASLKDIKEISVDIIPGESGLINSGLYLGASNAQSGQDQINALSIGLEAIYTEGDDANRLDLVVGSFPTWTEHLRVVSETGRSNALFTEGQKQPVNLRVTLEDNLLYITVSLLSDPTKTITGVYSVPEGTDLTCGYIGMRSQHSDAKFDNFTVITEKKAAVAQVGETTYATVAEAIANANGQVVTILADSNEAIVINSDVTVDLAGYVLSNVTVAEDAKLMLVDSTADYSGAKGSATVSGDVAAFTEADGKTYLVVGQDGVYSAHCYDVALTHISLKASKDALGYKAKIYGDATVQAHIQSAGFNMWLDGGETKTYKGNSQDLTLRLQNIMKFGGGEMNINATAFVMLAVGEETYTKTCDQYATTMKQTLQTVNANWDSYSETQRATVKALCDQYLDVVSDWELDNIYPTEEAAPAA